VKEVEGRGTKGPENETPKASKKSEEWGGERYTFTSDFRI